MASERQIAANRRNARRSTGPRTEAGRRASSLNALKHGFRSQVVVLPSENQADFDALLQAFADEARPASASDLAAVRKLAACEWRLRRLVGIETGMFTCLAAKARAAGLDSAPGIGVVSAAFLDGQLNRFAALNRIEASLDRQYRNSWRELDARAAPDASEDAAPASSGEPTTPASESAPARHAAAAAAEFSQSNPTAHAIQAGHPHETPQTNPTAEPLPSAEPDTATVSDGSPAKSAPLNSQETPQTNPTAEPMRPAEPDTAADSHGFNLQAAPLNPQKSRQTNPTGEPMHLAGPGATADSDGFTNPTAASTLSAELGTSAQSDVSLPNSAPLDSQATPQSNPIPVAPAAAKTPQTKPIAPAPSRRIARNALCPCGSKLKYKRCCGPDAPAVLHPGENPPRREAA